MSFDFPDDLVQRQKNFFAAEDALTRVAAEEAVTGKDGKPVTFDDTLAEFQRITMELHRHPLMNATNNRFQARMALREAARA